MADSGAVSEVIRHGSLVEKINTALPPCAPKGVAGSACVMVRKGLSGSGGTGGLSTLSLLLHCEKNNTAEIQRNGCVKHGKGRVITVHVLE